MAAKFGTSGLRGLVTELSSAVIADHVRAFLATCPRGRALHLGQDLRPSSPRMAADVAEAARAEGVDVIDHGLLATPALALAARAAEGCAIMITGSHIPADRNGLKFYTPAGEITKQDEIAILGALGRAPGTGNGQLQKVSGAEANYVQRYLQAFAPGALSGRRIGVYSHSAVARDALAQVINGLGAEVVELGRSAHFIPVDTEAVEPEVLAQIEAWVAEHRLDALVSLDGDSDRPLLADEHGQIVPGDIMGQITAEYLGAEVVVTPISSNSGITRKGHAQVSLTRIGSPYVIAAMAEASGRVVGYEANGGFLLGFDAPSLTALPTRDGFLPLLATLVAGGSDTLSQRVAREPSVVTRAARLQDVASERTTALLAHLAQNPQARAEFLAPSGTREANMDLTDGLRLRLEDGRILHLRASGNAPELRIYAEAPSRTEADALIDQARVQVLALLG